MFRKLLTALLLALSACQQAPQAVAPARPEESIEVIRLVNPLAEDLRRTLEEFLREEGLADDESARGGKMAAQRGVPRE